MHSEQDQNRLSIVVPCYNEQEVLPETVRRLRELLDKLVNAYKIRADSQVIFVDDGSRDGTWALIEQAHAQDPRVRGSRRKAMPSSASMRTCRTTSAPSKQWSMPIDQAATSFTA
jgi:glycosyltransferase involved in cell wall biosynthesis